MNNNVMALLTSRDRIVSRFPKKASPGSTIQITKASNLLSSPTLGKSDSS